MKKKQDFTNGQNSVSNDLYALLGTFKIMEKRITTIVKLIIGTIGLGLIIWKASWVIALGIFLLMWANNMDYQQRE